MIIFLYDLDIMITTIVMMLMSCITDGIQLKTIFKQTLSLASWLKFEKMLVK